MLAQIQSQFTITYGRYRFLQKERGKTVFKYTIRKLLAMIPKFLAITVVLFVLLELSPGDPLTRRVTPEVYKSMTETMKQEYYIKFGLDKPAVVRYFQWLGDLLKGDLGYSTAYGLPISELVSARLPSSMELQFGTLLFSGIIGVFLGFVCAVFQKTVVDYFFSGVSALGSSLPEYFFASAFMIIFAMKLGWFPTGGRIPTDILNPTFWDRIPYMTLPIASMTFTMVCGLVRHTRTTMVDVMNMEYIKTARSKGLSEFVVYFKHCLRNALPPVMTMLVMRLPMLVGGSVVIEQVFNYIGIGSLSMGASQNLDAPLCLFCITVSATVTLIASTLIDILTAALDPRVRFE